MLKDILKIIVAITFIFFCGCSAPQKKTIPKSIKPQVMVIIFNPVIDSEGDKRLTQVLNWNDPDSLAQVYRADLFECSDGYLDYQIVKRIEVDEYPIKMDGFRYDDGTFLECWRERQGFHQPDNVDYNAIYAQFDIISQVEQNLIDEVWCFAFPYSGFWETTMAGKNAFYCNSDPVPVPAVETIHELSLRELRRFITYGFNYEREVGCMLEDFGHAAESIMSHVFRNAPDDQNYWKKFTQYDKIAPGKSNCGNVHFAPNSEKDYEWGNPRFVISNCDDWLYFPNFKGITREVNYEEWGNGDMREHHKWWLKHIPRAKGEKNGIYHNWWYYLGDPNHVD